MAISLNVSAQAVNDVVSIGATYTDQVWYSLQNDEQGTAPKNNWDLAFDVSTMGSTVLINSVTGTTLWKYPKNDTAGWASIDTNGLSTWHAHWNSDTSWTYGAIGRYANPANPFDFDWGVYDLTTHSVIGDSLYIVQLANGDFKKLWIQSIVGTIISFKYANLDGSSTQYATFDKSLYPGKNFGYYSLQSNTSSDREPVSNNWDLLFTQHTAFVPIPYTVTGVLTNKGVQVAKRDNDANYLTDNTYSTASFNIAINTMGHDWKRFTGTSYAVQDSLLYFVKCKNGDIWKLIFTGFEGSSTGNYLFSREKLLTASAVPQTNASASNSLVLYPNPATTSSLNIVYDLATAQTSASLNIFDVTGKAVYTTAALGAAGLHVFNLPANLQLQSGMYIVTLSSENYTNKQTLIIQ